MEKLTIQEASTWATNYLKRDVSDSNISYLVQYAKINKYSISGKVFVDKKELKRYYDSIVIKKEKNWKNQLGNDLDWSLSFDNLRESETTKHVHRLHPYKGKFIPQLVQYFLDSHINTHKKKLFFKSGEIVLDPFMGSGTTLVQAKELGLHSIGIDISKFNCIIAETKLDEYDVPKVKSELTKALELTDEFSQQMFDETLDIDLKNKLYEFNKQYFPNPQYKQDIQNGKLVEEKYSVEKLKLFTELNKELLEKIIGNKTQKAKAGFLSKWFSPRIRDELFFYKKYIDSLSDTKIKRLMQVVLSRTARSCRATTHSDLATLKEPQYLPYYCEKHKKICTPIDCIIKHLYKNTYDTLTRINEFARLKQNMSAVVIEGDSRTANLLEEIKKQDKRLAELVKAKKIDGIFTSPPYVGQIDYHEQHAYAYELFNIQRKDELEIGPLYKGNNAKSREEYVEGVSKVLKNISKFVKDDGNFFIVANDKYNLYPIIAEKSGLKIVDQFKRPVLNRTEKVRSPYCEIIFHMKKF
ncbi:MAG: DNA methyltransferase [Candidatus Micrarchaeota archaeon]